MLASRRARLFHDLLLGFVLFNKSYSNSLIKPTHLHASLLTRHCTSVIANILHIIKVLGVIVIKLIVINNYPPFIIYLKHSEYHGERCPVAYTARECPANGLSTVMPSRPSFSITKPKTPQPQYRNQVEVGMYSWGRIARG